MWALDVPSQRPMSTPSYGNYLTMPEMSTYVDSSEPVIRSVLQPGEYSFDHKMHKVEGCRRFTFTTEAVIFLQSRSARRWRFYRHWRRRRHQPSRLMSVRFVRIVGPFMPASPGSSWWNNVTSVLPPRDAEYSCDHKMH